MKRRNGENLWNSINPKEYSRKFLPKSIQTTGHTVVMIEKDGGRFYSCELLDLHLAVSLMQACSVNHVLKGNVVI